MRLILVRHGASWHGERHVIGGPVGCSGLTPEGQAQAARLRDRFRRAQWVPDDAILLSGPWPRARETAEILQPAFRTTVQCDERLREIDPGAADGLRWDEYVSTFGAIDLLREPDRPFAPGGESHHQFVWRVEQLLQDLAKAHVEQTVVAVTHGGVVRASLLTLIGAPARGDIGPVRNTSVTVWEHGGTWVLERYNDTAHLE
jgi:probable phosphoglycerate mutase